MFIILSSIVDVKRRDNMKTGNIYLDNQEKDGHHVRVSKYGGA